MKTINNLPMRRILFLSACTLLLAACSQSPKEKAEALIKENLQSTLYHPDTYAPSSTQLDSAFAPYDHPSFYEMTLKVAKLGILVSECEEEASRLRTSMSIWQGPYQTAFDRQNYKEYKAKYDAVVAKKSKAEKEGEKLGKELRALKDQNVTFIGFKAIHTYRAENNAGQTVGGNMLYIFDKDMKQIIAAYDMDSQEFQAVNYIYKGMRGETSMADEVSLDK